MLVKQLSALHPELQAEAGVDENVNGPLDGQVEVAKHNSVEEPQWRVFLARRLAVVPVAYGGGLVEAEDSTRLKFENISACKTTSCTPP